MAEAAVVSASVRVLDRRGTYHANIQIMGRAGVPDRFFVHRGEPGLLEFKTAKGKLRPIQVWEHKRAAKAGVRVYVVRSAADMTAVLDAIDARLDAAQT